MVQFKGLNEKFRIYSVFRPSMSTEFCIQNLPVYFPYYEIEKSTRTPSVPRTEYLKFIRIPSVTRTRTLVRVRDGYGFHPCTPEYGRESDFTRNSNPTF